MIAYYRISNNSYRKERYNHATKEHCLETFYTATIHAPFGDRLKIYADSVNDQLYEWLINFANTHDNVELFRTSCGSGAQSFKLTYTEALEDSPDQLILFQEDDYLHKVDFLNGVPLNRILLEEALSVADYTSLYDHVDKYIPASKGGNPFIGEDGGEVTKVILTNHSHWKLTNSTTMTFATRQPILQEDKDVWYKYTQGTHPNDFAAFLELRERGRSLITPIPGRTTHAEPRWASPLVDWTTI